MVMIVTIMVMMMMMVMLVEHMVVMRDLSMQIELDPHIDDHHVGFELPPDRIEKVFAKHFHFIPITTRNPFFS